MVHAEGECKVNDFRKENGQRQSGHYIMARLLSRLNINHVFLGKMEGKSLSVKVWR